MPPRIFENTSKMSNEEKILECKKLEQEIKILMDSLEDPGVQLVQSTIREDAHMLIMATLAGDPNACVFAVAKYQGLVASAEMASDMIHQKSKRRERLLSELRNKDSE